MLNHRLTRPLFIPAPDLAHEEVGLDEVLDDLVRVDDVEAGVLVRQRLVEVVRDHLDAAAGSFLGKGRHELDSVHVVRADSLCQLHRELTVVAAEVE